MISAEELLYAPHLKLKRAEHHINDLNARINDFLAYSPPKVIISFRSESRELAIRLKENAPIPPEFSLIIGDTVHNLRSALDLTLFPMARDKARKPERIQFPFPKDGGSKAFKEACKAGQVEFAGEKVVEEIRLLKPCPTGNAVLNGIHAISNTDKHRLLVLVQSMPSFMMDTDAGIFYNRFLGAGDYGPLGIGEFSDLVPKGFTINLITSKDGDIMRVTLTGTDVIQSFEGEAAVQPPFVISFAADHPFAHKPVILSLHEAKTEAASAVKAMVAAFLHP
jgi:hypothetical protein